MAGVFMCPKTCGFGRVVALEASRKVNLPREKGESNTKYNSRLKQEIYKSFKKTFTTLEENFNIDFAKFTKNLPTLKDAINKWNFRKIAEKHRYLSLFSLTEWEKLSANRKSEHTFFICKGCALRYAKIQALFPVKSQILKRTASKNPVFCASEEAKLIRKQNGQSAVTPSQKDIKNAAKAIYDKVSPIFEKHFNTNLAEALSKVPNLNIQHKSPEERRRERRKHYKNSKVVIEEQMEETAFIRCYGGGESLRGWQRKRLAMSFETKTSAKKRKTESLCDSNQDKNHCGNFDTMEWDKIGLKREVELYESGREINWSDLARRYKIKETNGGIARNGGQIVKEWLKQEGVDIDRFKGPQDSSSNRVRRRKRRGMGGEITIPTEVTTDRLREMAKEKIASGEYTVGQRIVPKKFEKLVLTKEMEIKKVDFVLEGRKVPLEEIRQKTLKKHEKYMRVVSDDHYDAMTRDEIITRLKELSEYSEDKYLETEELRGYLKQLERKRHFMIWHDNSTMANHGYLVCLVSVMYDPAIFLTADEFHKKTGNYVDVQTLIEKPEVHFIARSSSADAEQLVYGETRLDCIKQMSHSFKTSNGIEIIDILRCFHGDSPAREFECGQQKGGNYYCSNCGCHAVMADDISHALNCPLVSLQDRVEIIMNGAVSKTNTHRLKSKPLKELSREELENELASRGVFDGKTKQELQKLLDKEMRGVQRLQALLVSNPQKSLPELGLENYKILPTELLHDVGPSH